MANTAVTISKARVSRLKNPERHGGFNYKATVLYTDVNLGSGSTDTVTLTLGSTPATWVINAAAVVVRTAFAGTGAFTIQVGTSTQSAACVAATTVLSAGVIATAGFAPASAANSTGTSAATLQALFTNATSGSPSALSAGSLDIYLSILDTAQIG